MIEIASSQNGSRTYDCEKVNTNTKLESAIIPMVRFVTHGAEDIEIITEKNHLEGLDRKARSAERRRQKEYDYQRKLDRLALIGIVSMISLIIGIEIFAPDAVILLGIAVAGVISILCGWMK